MNCPSDVGPRVGELPGLTCSIEELACWLASPASPPEHVYRFERCGPPLDHWWRTVWTLHHPWETDHSFEQDEGYIEVLPGHTLTLRFYGLRYTQLPGVRIESRGYDQVVEVPPGPADFVGGATRMMEVLRAMLAEAGLIAPTAQAEATAETGATDTEPRTAAPEPPPKPPKDAGFESWFEYMHDAQDRGYKCTLRMIAGQVNLSYGYVRHLHALWKADKNT